MIESIPSGFIPEDPGGTYPSGPAPTSVIPGSNVLETTGLQRRTLPAPSLKPDWRDKLSQIMMLTGAGIQDVYRPPGMKTDAALKAVEQMRALRDERSARHALAYMARLQALAMSDPSRAKDAILDLSDFVTTNAEYIPLPVLQTAQKTLEQLKGLHKAKATSDALQTFAASPTLDIRMKEFARLMQGNPDMDPQLALAMVKAIPDPAVRWEYHVHPKTGTVFKLDKLGQEPPQTYGGGPVAADIKIPEAARSAYDLMWKPGMPTTAELETAYQQGDPRAQAIVGQAQAQVRTMAETDKERAQRKVIDKGDLDILGAHLPLERMKQLQYYKDLDEGDYKLLQRAKQQEFTMKNYTSALINRVSIPVDAQGNQITYDPMQVEQVARLVAGKQAFLVQRDQLAKINAIKKHMADLVLLDRLVNRLLVSTDKAKGANWGNAIKLFGGNLLGDSDVALMRGVTGKMGIEMAVAIQGSRPSVSEDEAAQKVVPGITDSLAQGQKKIRYMLMRGQQVIGIETGALVVTDDSLAASVNAHFPEYAAPVSPTGAPKAGHPGTSGSNARTIRKLW